ncbi:hypothetical protein RI129_001763 [Pyrocoelia pectoralis]|uniref:Uncharacterized protein n=1 Tax=Pyrocoelia pectoralis TaxID=417401 RepID=A0AAN7W081_9COLE
MPAFSYLSFEHSHVPTIFVSLFSNFTSVTHLYMNATHVEHIQQGGFNGLDKLQVLQLANNELTEIPRGILNHLSHLVILNISHNHIDMIENNAFMGLLALKKLILNHNNVKVLHPNTFPYLKFIQVIDLSYNMIIDVSRNAFENNSQNEGNFVTNEINLDLSHNYIKSLNLSYISVPFTTLNVYNNSLNEFISFNSSYLHYLSLGNNNISNIHLVGEMLTYLDLRANRISELNSNLLTHSKLLQTVDLSYNYLHSLHDDFFMTLTSLLSLSLNNNNLVHVPIGCFHSLSSLQLLNISGNKIPEFEHGTFSGLNKLVTLDISNNILTYLYESTFHPLVKLESLYLDHNLITSFDPYYVTEHLKALKGVSLNYNPWNCKSLSNIFFILTSKGVTVFEGKAKKTVNIKGITCTNKKSQMSDHTTSQDISKQVNDLQTFYSFFNSQFEQFFKNVSYAHFEELKFLDDFQKLLSNIPNEHENITSNNAIFRQLNDTMSKLVIEFQSLPDKLANYSANERNQLQEYIVSRYFNSESINRTICTHFDKDKELDSSIVSQLSSLNQFLNANFNNSSYYKFSQSNNLSKYGSEYKENDSPKFDKFVNVDDRVVTEISGLQHRLNTLLIIIIIVLCCLLILLVIKSFNNPLQKFTRRNDNMSADSRATMEMI